MSSLSPRWKMARQLATERTANDSLLLNISTRSVSPFLRLQKNLTDQSADSTHVPSGSMPNSSQTRENLLAAMRDLIWVGSYAGTSVDEICRRAKVHKGSFYHHFPSKSKLAIASIESCWEEHRVGMDGIFSPSKVALQRLFDWLVYLREEQAVLRSRFGRVVGCPLHTIGAELGGKEDPLHDLLKTVLGDYLRYLESALRDARAEDTLEIDDVTATARLTFFYVEGLLTHARIWNDLTELDQMESGVRQLLGHPEQWPSQVSSNLDLTFASTLSAA
ncbi:MAG: TetR/AcrR family transcriptional regulator [Verrucomicrobiota bacterium]